MPPADALWLTMDRPTALMVVDVAVVIEGAVGLEVVRSAFADLVDRHPVFACRAQRRPLGWSWVEDEDFDLDNHVGVVRVGPHVTIADVQAYVGAQRSVPLDPAHPPWSAAVVEDVTLDDGTVGSVVLTRFHHAIADGVRLTQVLLGMLAPDGAPTVPAVSRRPTGGIVDPAAAVGLAVDATAVASHVVSTAARTGAQAVRDPLAAVTGVATVGGRLLGALRHPDRVVDATEVVVDSSHRSWNDAAALAKLTVGGTTPTVWTGTPGTDKVLAWSAPMDLGPIRAAARARKVTFNDLLVAGLVGALRSYLSARAALVDEVVWMVPVNLDPFDADLPTELGNHFALVLLDLPLTGGTPDARVADVRRRMSRIKDSDEPVVTFALQRAISTMPAPVAAQVIGFFADKTVGILSDVPGPREPLSFGGARVRQVVGFAPCSGRQPLTATIFTYAGTVTIGFASDAGLVPDPAELVDLFVDELGALTSS